jgi:serine/threonine-protein kinase
MGEVYRARDSKLDRDVALKILPDSFASDSDRVMRFEREAKTLASLNHPHIAQIYDFGQVVEAGRQTRLLALELVDGEDLSQRISRGPIPMDEALPIAKQIAEALESAHEHGIIHRDLKPANIKVRDDGTVKVLDFGLAKAFDPVATSSVEAMNSPTLSIHATQAGVILGTAAYMSPEQAKGRAIDKRADVWAFGCVLHEMLTGERLFAADSVPETLGLIFSRDPDLTSLPPATPARVRALIARCLVRDPRQRLRDIGEARLTLGDLRDPPIAVERPVVPVFQRAVPWTIAAAAALIAGWAVMDRPSAAITAREITQLDIGYPRDVENFPGTTMSAAISPDGRTVALIGVKDGIRRVFIRRLEGATATELQDTTGANGAAFSPDGASLAVLFNSGLITRLSLSDLQRKVVTAGADITQSMTWTEAGIIFSRAGALMIISPEGGTPRALSTLDPSRREMAHGTAVVMPGGRVVMFSVQTAELGTERIESVPVDGGPRAVVMERARTPVWSPTGHLLFARDGGLFAVAVDQDTGTPRGTAIQVIPPSVIEPLTTGQLSLSLSSNGTLLMAPVGFTDTQVVSVGRDGAVRALDWQAGIHSNPRISPDGRRMLVEGDGTVEALDLTRGTRARLVSSSLISAVFRRGRGTEPACCSGGLRCRSGLRATAAARQARCPPESLATSPWLQDPISIPFSSCAFRRRRPGTCI